MAAPIIRSLPPLAIVSGKKYIYQPVATDVDNDIDHWTLSGAPSGMTLDTVTGRITWSPVAGVTTSGQLILSVVDEASNTTSQIFTLTVNTPPHIISTPPVSASVGVAFVYQPLADDPESNISSSGWSLTSAPAGMTIDSMTGRVSWTPGSSGTYSFILRATDTAGLSDAQVITLIVT